MKLGPSTSSVSTTLNSTFKTTSFSTIKMNQNTSITAFADTMISSINMPKFNTTTLNTPNKCNTTSKFCLDIFKILFKIQVEVFSHWIILSIEFLL